MDEKNKANEESVNAELEQIDEEETDKIAGGIILREGGGEYRP